MADVVLRRGRNELVVKPIWEKGKDTPKAIKWKDYYRETHPEYGTQSIWDMNVTLKMR